MPNFLDILINRNFDEFSKGGWMVREKQWEFDFETFKLESLGGYEAVNLSSYLSSSLYSFVVFLWLANVSFFPSNFLFKTVLLKAERNTFLKRWALN